MKNQCLFVVLFLVCLISGGFATGYVTNLGSGVNTQYTESDPFVTADGLKLYFTKYISSNTDIWEASWVGGMWTNATPVSGVNSSSFDEHPWVIGNHMYFCTDRWGGSRLAMATYGGGSWGNVVQLPMSSLDGVDAHPSVTADETTIYFASSRAPSFGGLLDIFKATNNGGTWGNIVNLGPAINTSAPEDSPGISPDGNTLHFIRNIEHFSIYVSIRTGTTWSPAQPLPAFINDEYLSPGVSYRPETQKLYFTSGRLGSFGQTDLWQCSYYNVGVEPTSIGRIKGMYKN